MHIVQVYIGGDSNLTDLGSEPIFPRQKAGTATTTLQGYLGGFAVMQVSFFSKSDILPFATINIKIN